MLCSSYLCTPGSGSVCLHSVQVRCLLSCPVATIVETSNKMNHRSPTKQLALWMCAYGEWSLPPGVPLPQYGLTVDNPEAQLHPHDERHTITLAAVVTVATRFFSYTYWFAYTRCLTSWPLNVLPGISSTTADYYVQCQCLQSLSVIVTVVSSIHVMYVFWLKHKF